jgi:hypothetical protein
VYFLFLMYSKKFWKKNCEKKLVLKYGIVKKRANRNDSPIYL